MLRAHIIDHRNFEYESGGKGGSHAVLASQRIEVELRAPSDPSKVIRVMDVHYDFTNAFQGAAGIKNNNRCDAAGHAVQVLCDALLKLGYQVRYAEEVHGL
jgi:hypothetical protein